MMPWYSHYSDLGSYKKMGLCVRQVSRKSDFLTRTDLAGIGAKWT